MRQPEQPVTISFATILKVTLTVIGVLLGLELLGEIQGILIFLFIALLLASAIKPIVNAAVRRGYPRSLTVLAIYLVLVLVIGLMISVVVPPIAQQASTFVKNAPGYLNQLQALLREYAANLGLNPSIVDLQQLADQADTLLPLLAGGLFRYTLTTFTGLLGTISVLVISYYWLAERHSIGQTWLSLLSSDQQVRMIRVGRQIESRWGGWVRGQLVLCVVVGLCALIGNMILGVPYAIVLALFAGLTEAIPTVGPILGAIPAIALAFTDSPQKALLTAGLYIMIQQLENAILVPKVMEHSVGLRPLTVFVSVLTGGALLGIAGAVLAVPVASALHVIAMEFLFVKKQEVAIEAAAPANGATQEARAPDGVVNNRE